MADNVQINSGSGPIIAAEDMGSVYYQRVKVLAGEAGESAPLGHAEDTAHASGDGGMMALAVRNDQGTPLAGTHGDYIPLSTDSKGNLRVNLFGPGTVDSFGHVVTGSLNNQIDIQYYRSDGSVGDLVTETNANGGTATATNGMATFAATTTASSQAKGVTTETTTYTAGAEVYCLFTAAFTGTGSGTSYHRIGLYDTNNGFFIGYEGGTFGVTVRKGASDVQTPKASWNIDTLTGAAGSAFTRGGTPESVDLTKLNVWRIRFGWVGSAPVKFEVLGPDGNWVTFHEIRQPNNAVVPSINTADLPVTCDVNSGNSSAALSILTNCWCAGTTHAAGKLSATLKQSDYAELVRAVITGWSTAGGGAFVNVKVNPSGALTVDASGSTITVTGSVAHDAVDANNPVKIGHKAIAHGANPTAVAAADRTDWYANRHGIPFVLSGHMNVITVKHTTITTAVTDAAIVTVGAGAKIVVTRISYSVDVASSVNPSMVIGFGTANTPTTTGVLFSHGGIRAGDSQTIGCGGAILGIGADNEDLRVTTTGNATGNGLQITVSYFTIES